MSVFKNFGEKCVTDVISNYFILLPSLILICGLLMRWQSRKSFKLPPGPVALPLVGYLPFLGKEPHKTLHRLKNTYGNVFSLYLGQNNVVVLADYKAVEDAFSKTTTLHRPADLFGFLPDGIGFADKNGEEWAEQRKFVMRTMKDLGLGKSTWTNLIEEELHDFLKVIENSKGRPINIHQLLSRSISNNIFSLVFGKRFQPGPELDSVTAASDATMAFFSQSALWNFFPKLCNLLAKLRISSYHKALKEMVVFNTFMRKQVDDHKKSSKDAKATDFVSQYLDAMVTNRSKGRNAYFTESNMVGNIQNLFFGGSDTVRTSLTWIFLCMAAFPSVQRKVVEELESTLGNREVAFWEDRTKFPYTYAVIMEAQRWITLVPLNTSRIAAENTKICGYDVLKGSTIIANNWGVHNDPKYWPNPENFIPERFLQNEGREVNLKPESYVPFSYGKRKCPGDSIAMMEIFLYFSSVIRRFEVRGPNGENPNFDGVLGITYEPIQKVLCFLPRH